MKKLQAFGAIGLLLTILIAILLFLFMLPVLKDFSAVGLGGNDINKESVEKHVNKQLEEIERMRQQTVNANKNLNQEY